MMTRVIGEGAYDTEGHRNSRFLNSTEVGPFPKEMRHAWTMLREEAATNYGIGESDGQEEWRKMGPLADPSPATVRNIGVAERKKAGRVQAFMTTPGPQRRTRQT